MAGLARALAPASRGQALRRHWEVKRMEPIRAQDRAPFAARIARLTAPDAVDRIMAEVEPKFAEARPQAPSVLLMALGAVQMANASPDSDLTVEQRAALRGMLPGFRAWASGTDFLDLATARDAITLMVEAARRTGITSPDPLRALPLEGVPERGRPLLAAAKDVRQRYGLDVDAIADSLTVEVLSNDGKAARVRTTVPRFGAPFRHGHARVLLEGRGYGRHALEFGPPAVERLHRDRIEHEIEVEG